MKRQLAALALTLAAAPASAIPMICDHISVLPDQPRSICTAQPPWKHPCSFWMSNGMRVLPFNADPTFPVAQVRCGFGTIKYNTILRVGYQGYLTWKQSWYPFATITERAEWSIYWFTGKCPLTGAQLP